MSTEKSTRPIPPLVPEGGCLSVYDGNSYEELDTRPGTVIDTVFRDTGDVGLYHWGQGPRGCRPLNDGVNAQQTGNALTLMNLNLRENPSLTAKVLTVVPVGERVALSGKVETIDGLEWRSVIHRSHVGWMYAKHLSMTFNPDMTHYYPWYLESAVRRPLEVFAGLIDAVLRDPRGCVRAGIEAIRVYDPADTSAIIRIVEPAVSDVVCGKAGVSCVRTSGGKSIATLNVEALVTDTERGIRLINHEIAGHAMLGACDTYPGNIAGIDPALTSGIMDVRNETTAAGVTSNIWFDNEDTRDARLYVSGKAARVVRR